MELSVPVHEGEEYDVKVEGIGEKGDGIAKIGNYTIIIPGTKYGDKIKIRIIRTLPRYAFAEKVS